MSITDDGSTNASRTEVDLPQAAQDNAESSDPPTTEGWTPEDRAPSAAESNFLSFALFGFLILFGIGCFLFF